MENDADIKTSMPSLMNVEKAWQEALDKYEQVIYIVMSSALSGSYEAAKMYAEQEYSGKVFVVDSRRVSVPQKQFVLDTLTLVNSGLETSKVVDILNNSSLDSIIYVIVDTLKFLQKGGRITPAVAKIGSLLKIKPILRFQGGKLDLYKTSRTLKGAIKTVRAALDKEVVDTLKCTHDDVVYEVAYSSLDNREANKVVASIKEETNCDVLCEPLALVLSCHIGPNGLGIAVTKKVKE